MNELKQTISLLVVLAIPSIAFAQTLAVDDLKRDSPVDFANEIFPILKQNCLACHHARESEGGLNLESHKTLITGGDSGAGAIAQDFASSLILSRASGAEGDLMPPEDNSVGAKPLTPYQLGLIKLWIQQGAVGGEIASELPIAWQPIPESLRTTYALDVSFDGRLIAAGHGNRITIYDLATTKEVARLVDPALESISGRDAADVDLIQSVAFSPDGNRIATGGFRTVRLWKKSVARLTAASSPLASAGGLISANSDASQLAMINAIGDIEIWDAQNQRRMHILAGHADTITGLVWADGLLVSCDAEGHMIAWSPLDGRQVANQSTLLPLASLAISNDGSAIAATDSRRRVHLWRIQAGEQEKRTFAKTNLPLIKEVADAQAIAFTSKPSPNLIVASESAGAQFFDLRDGKRTRQINHGGGIGSLAVSPDGTLLATAGRLGQIKLWQTEDGKAVRTMQGSPSTLRQLAIADQNTKRQVAAVKRLNALTESLAKAVAKEDEAVKKIVEARDKASKELADKEKKRSDAIARVNATEAAIEKANADAASSRVATEQANKIVSDSMAAIANLNQEVAARNESLARTNQEIVKAQQQIAAAQKTLNDAKATADKLNKELAEKKAAVNKANESIATAKQQIETSKKAALTAKALLDKSTKELDSQKKAVTAAEEDKKKSLAEVTKRKQALAAASQAQARAKSAVPAHALVLAAEQRREESVKQQLAFANKLMSNPSNACINVAFSSDGKLLTTAHADQSVRIYRVSDGTALESYPATDSQVGVALIKNQVCSFTESGRASIWPLEPTWVLERTIGSHQSELISDRVTAIDFRADGLSIAIGSGPPSRSGDVKIFAVETGEMVRDFGDIHSDTVLGLRFSPDGRSLASSAADKTVRTLDIATGKIVRSFEGHTHHVLAVDWQDDGQTLASASADQNVKVWNSGTGEQRKTITGFGKEITAISFLQQTSQIITACADGQLRLHDALNGKSLRSFNASGDFLYALAVTADGKTLIAGGQSGVIRIWNVADAKLIREIK